MDDRVLGELEYVLCPGSRPRLRSLEIYNQIYGCWKEWWTETLRSCDIDEPPTGECFTRQDYFGALFHRGQCIALCSYRWSRTDYIGHFDDSYFNCWSQTTRRALHSQGPLVIVCGNFCVAPEYRGRRPDFSCKDLLMGLVVETFLASEADALSGSVRVSRRMNDLTVNWGAAVLEASVDSGYGTEKVDQIGFFRDQVASVQGSPWKPWVQQLWARHHQIPQESIALIRPNVLDSEPQPKTA